MPPHADPACREAPGDRCPSFPRDRKYAVEDRSQRLSLDSRDQESEQVRSAAVRHYRPGLADQGQLREPRDPVVGHDMAVNIAAQRLAVRLRDQPAIKVRIRPARPMCQKVLECDEPFGGIRLLQRTIKSCVR
jgi:hypothetical protein